MAASPSIRPPSPGIDAPSQGSSPQTITFAPLSGKAYGDAPFTVSATATSGLAVTFTVAPAGVCTATGTNGSTITIVGAGTCTVTANQAGNASYAPAPPVARSFGITLPAIFANNQGCTTAPLNWSGSGASVTGAVHSNGAFTLTGSGSSVSGPSTYVCGTGPKLTGNTFTPAPAKTAIAALPIVYTAASFAPCTYTFPNANTTYNLGQAGPWWVGGTSSSGKLNAGLYCVTGANSNISLSGSGVTGTITIVATGTISLTGSGLSLTPYTNGVLLYSQKVQTTGTPAIGLTGSGLRAQGLLYAPGGQVAISGSGLNLHAGSIVADTVTLTGSGLVVTAPTTPPAGVAGQATAGRTSGTIGAGTSAASPEVRRAGWWLW